MARESRFAGIRQRPGRWNAGASRFAFQVAAHPLAFQNLCQGAGHLLAEKAAGDADGQIVSMGYTMKLRPEVDAGALMPST